MPDLFGHDWETYDFLARAIAEGWQVLHGGKPPAIRFTDTTGGGGGTWDPGLTPSLWVMFESLPRAVLYKSIGQQVEHQRHYDRSFVRLTHGYIHEVRIIFDALTLADMALLRLLRHVSDDAAGVGETFIHIKLHADDEFYIRCLMAGDWEPDYPEGAWGEPKPWWYKYELKIKSQIAYPEVLHNFMMPPPFG